MKEPKEWAKTPKGDSARFLHSSDSLSAVFKEAGFSSVTCEFTKREHGGGGFALASIIQQEEKQQQTKSNTTTETTPATATATTTTIINDTQANTTDDSTDRYAQYRTFWGLIVFIATK